MRKEEKELEGCTFAPKIYTKKRKPTLANIASPKRPVTAGTP